MPTQKWINENKEHLRNYKKLWKEKNIEKVKAYSKNLSIEKQEKRKKYKQEYYIKNKEHIKYKNKINNTPEKRRVYNLKNKTAIREYEKDYHMKNKEKAYLSSRKRSLRKLYGISLDEYNEMFIKQNGCCAICGRHQNELNRKLFVDHNHNSGVIRSLLCHKCNIVLGLVNENIDVLEKMIIYIKSHDDEE